MLMASDARGAMSVRIAAAEMAISIGECQVSAVDKTVGEKLDDMKPAISECFVAAPPGFAI
jgi:hypothetical protein